MRETQLKQAKSGRMCPDGVRFFDNCILGNKEKDTGSNIRPEGRTETSTLLENDTWENYGEH